MTRGGGTDLARGRQCPDVLGEGRYSLERNKLSKSLVRALDMKEDHGGSVRMGKVGVIVNFCFLPRGEDNDADPSCLEMRRNTKQLLRGMSIVCEEVVMVAAVWLVKVIDGRRGEGSVVAKG